MTQSKSNSKLVGVRVNLKDSTYYAGHWGFVREYKGDGMYIVSGGSIGENLQPLVHRSEFVVPRRKSNARRGTNK